LDSERVRALAFDVAERGYDLLLGLRRHRDWTALRPRAVEASLAALLRAYRVVVADIEADVEGEAECGSLDVEERNTFARSAARAADVVLVVGCSEMKGVHALVREVRSLLELGIAAERVTPVINRSSLGPRARATLQRTIADLLSGAATSPPLHLASHRHLDRLVRDGSPLPANLCAPLAATVAAVIARAPTAREPTEPARVAPGSLGSSAAEPQDAFT
jgi:hypothetical protein